MIASVGRRGLRRLFAPRVLAPLALITPGCAADFSLMFTPDGRPRIDRKALAAKADELDGKICKLIIMRDGLRRAAACSAPSHMERPTFRRLMRAAASGVIRAPEKSAPYSPFT